MSGWKPEQEIIEKWLSGRKDLPEGKKERLQVFADWFKNNLDKFEQTQAGNLALYLTIHGMK